MDMLLLVKAAIMGIVEGLTEFLPISSTGHLILAGSLLDFTSEKAKVFDIAIQTGAIFAVILFFWRRLVDTAAALGDSSRARRFVLNVLIAFLPAVVIGLLVGKAVKAHLFTPTVVATSFIAGALVILWAERRPKSTVRVFTVDDMSPLDALKVEPPAMSRASSGRQPFGIDHHRRNAGRTEPQRGDRVQLLSRDTHTHRRGRVQPLQGTSSALGDRRAFVRRRIDLLVPERMGVRALAAALCGDA
ncbi:hypothetical protein CBA19CS42_17750 [Caballeronia novacaledonica]|uniref:Undecaprenyl-diphosphatase n=1 Tax=Caballeronia novacaledonica TaxID=1544861 RepID=A0AA37ID45_9BURK|nr:hypothetical protein CBA19CS42_17750 [Caballeronia novacaledonica]